MFKGVPIPKSFLFNETLADLGSFYAWQLVPWHAGICKGCGNSPSLSPVSNGMYLIAWPSFFPEEMGTKDPLLFSALTTGSSLWSYFLKRRNVCLS